MSERPFRILVIEDNSDDVLFIRQALRNTTLNYQLDVISDGASALSYLFSENSSDRARANLPDLIFLDLQLPKISGLEVLFQIKSHQQTRNIPTIVLTASDDEEQIDECYDMGANSYVHKSLNPHQFMQAIQQTGYYWLKHNRLLKADEKDMQPQSSK